MNENKSAYRGILKATGLFGGTQILLIAVQLVRTKIVAILLGTTGVGMLGLYNAPMNYIGSLTGLGLAGYIFDKLEFNYMLENIKFVAPNSLEGRLQMFIPIYKRRTGICPINASAVCVHANLVQTECKNNIIGTFGIEELLEKWQLGLQIDLEMFYDKVATEAQMQRYSFKPRDN